MFESQTPQAIAKAIAHFDPDSYDAQRIRQHALQWDKAIFRQRLKTAVSEPADE
jgi:hypothetical protein